MLLEFIKRAWRPYFLSLISVSCLLGVVFSVTSGGGSVDGIVTLIIAVIMIAAPVSLFLAMPLAFWGWHVLQRRSVALGSWLAAALGFGAGTLLHLAFLMGFGGWLALPGILPIAALGGGLYGAVFSFLFSIRGGFGPTGGAPSAAPNP